MKIIVVGAGLIGLTTAYYLRKHGHEVTVLDRQAGPGLETSFANGALLTPSMSEPWNTPGSWRVLLGSLVRRDAALQLRLSALPGLAGWGIKFLRNSNPRRYSASTLSNLKLALYSLKVQQTIRQETGIDYGAAARGILKLFRSARALDNALTAADRLAREGLAFRRLSSAETVELEPALGPIADQLAGAIHYKADETGDAYQFCVGLTERLIGQGVEFYFNTPVTTLGGQSGRVTAVRTSSARLVAELYIVAAGSYSAPLVRPLGVHLPVRPAKGYSVTFDSQKGPGPKLKIPIVDDEMHAAVVPVGNAIRAAGTAEFSGYDVEMRQGRVQNLLNLAEKLLPKARLDAGTVRPWCALRPMSADGVPIIGRTQVPNLWVSTGHGHLGWTMAAGSGNLLADLISGESPAIDPAPYRPGR